jgi:drug/metabolite transporter (DMT)-like permease
MPSARSENAWKLQFLSISAIWGSSFLFIKVLDRHWPAVWVAFGRISLGALTLVLLVLARGESLPRDRRLWLHCLVAGALFNDAPFTLFAFGEKHVSSILAGLWNATTPLWVLLVLLAAFPEERPTRGRLAGMAVGFAGVALLLGPWRGLGGGTLVGHAACAGAAMCYGLGFPYTRRYLASRAESGMVLSACQLICATVLLGPFLALTHAPTAHIAVQGWGSLLALGALGSGVAYALNYAVVRARGSAVASTVTYLIPVVSTVLGVVVLGETLHWNQPVGAAIMLAGIAFSQGRLGALARARRRTADSPMPLGLPGSRDKPSPGRLTWLRPGRSPPNSSPREQPIGRAPTPAPAHPAGVDRSASRQGRPRPSGSARARPACPAPGEPPASPGSPGRRRSAAGGSATTAPRRT